MSQANNEVKPVAYRFKERYDDERSSWLYVNKIKQVPLGIRFEPVYTHPQSDVLKQLVEALEVILARFARTAWSLEDMESRAKAYAALAAARGSK